MSVAVLPPPSWTRRRWLYAIASVFALQLALVWWLAQPERRPPVRPLFRTTVQVSADGDLVRRIAETPGTFDPTLLALPSVDGFSGDAWLRFSTFDYRPSASVDTAHALALDTRSLAVTFSQFLATNVITPMLIADRPMPALPRYEPNYPMERPATQTLARIEGSLAARPLRSAVDLKSWPAAEILSNSVIQAGVDAAGFTFSAVLLSSSGSSLADYHALVQAANARFQAVRPAGGVAAENGRELTWGRWVFQWHTLPMPVTNPVAPVP